MSLEITKTGFWKNVEANHHGCCEELCQWIIKFFENEKDKPVYDFGCGIGQYSRRLSNAGFDVVGFEGSVPPLREFGNIQEQDLSKPFTLPKKGNCVFLEVAEHIPAQFENVLLDNISNACDNKLVMSWALRGQGGWGHVNELNNEEAISRIEAKNFIYLPEQTLSARQAIPDNTKLPWFKNTTLIFEKKK